MQAKHINKCQENCADSAHVTSNKSDNDHTEDKIMVYDVTGGWNADKYSIQKGHTVKLSTTISCHDIKHITWDLDNGDTSHDTIVYHVFQKEIVGSDDRVDGEGYVTVKCKVITCSGKIYRAAKKLLIVPVVECELVFEQYEIGNLTKCIDLVGAAVCGEVDIGNPFCGDPNYVCGGACIDSCPRYEVVVGELEGTYICQYGKHRICAPVNLFVGDRKCIPLYADDVFGMCGKYPPVVADVCIVPINTTILVNNFHDKPLLRTLTVDGVARKMLPRYVKFQWEITEIATGKTIITRTRTKSRKWVFEEAGEHDIRVTIAIPCCEHVIVEANVIVNPFSPDVVIQSIPE